MTLMTSAALIFAGGMLICGTVAASLVVGIPPVTYDACMALGCAVCGIGSINVFPLATVFCAALFAWSSYQWWNGWSWRGSGKRRRVR